MRPAWHVAVGVGLGAAAYQMTSDWRMAASFTAAEVLVDLDHALEHMCRSDRPFCLKTFFGKRNSLDWPKMVFILHAYEWVILLTISSVYFSRPVLGAAALGLAVHLLLDEIGNRRFIARGYFAPGFYFFSYRLYRGFLVRNLIREAGGKE